MKTVTLKAVREPQAPIPAVNELRAVAGYGLIEAKNIVDSLRGRNGPYLDYTMDVMDNQVAQLEKTFELEVKVVAKPEPVNKARAMEGLKNFAAELLDKGNFVGAGSVCNILSILKTVENYE